MTTRLLLVRHGETDWNLTRRIQGSTDIPLNDTGRRQARRLCEALRDEPIDAAYSSDLSRAVQTANELLRNGSVLLRTDPGLRERHHGAFQGRTYEEAAADFPAFAAREPDFDPPGGGESLRTFYARVAVTLDRIADAWPDGRILIVTHGGVLDAANRLASGLPLARRRDFAIRNATVNRLARENGRWRILAWDVDASDGRGLDELP